MNIDVLKPLFCPPGRYQAMLVSADKKKARCREGCIYLELTFKILSPEPYAGLLVVKRLYLTHPNSVAVETSLEKFRYLCRALGYDQPPKSLDDLLFKRLDLVLGVETFNNRPINVVERFYRANTARPAFDDDFDFDQDDFVW